MDLLCGEVYLRCSDHVIQSENGTHLYSSHTVFFYKWSHATYMMVITMLSVKQFGSDQIALMPPLNCGVPLQG
jgi:hypothetical protein